ncbi:hypothetical protein INT45_003819 [Circinella minor]|uniref:BCAS3 domain-containing protein n=1 Tax=Circinella minor TaxID=1195481 RepID=A0A8H7SCX8_9FUNG|nr:hypothetical protein INT45_003819 [Circinella minor]
MNAGVRAEPKFLRNPTSLEYLSSGLNWVSDQLTYNFQKRQSNASLFTQEQHGPQSQNPTHCRDHHDHPQQQPLQGVTTSGDNETVTFAAFQNVNRSSLSSPSLLLLLGYRNGFQVWDVTSPENVHETCSLRDQTIGDIHGMHILEDPNICDNNCNLVDLYAEARPLLAIMTHQMIKDFTELLEQGINGCLDDRLEASLHILSASDFSKQEILTDVYCHSAIKPVFTLGTRYIAYASTATNSDYESNELLTHIVNDKDVAGAAKDIAKEVVHGVKSLTEESSPILTIQSGMVYREKYLDRQRRPMHHHDQNSYCNHQKNNFDNNNNWTTSSSDHSVSTLEHSLNDRQQYCTKLATHLLPMSKTPHLLNNSATRASLSFWKSHASNLLTNKKFSLSTSIANNTTDVTSDPYLPYDNAWSTTSADKNDNNRMFGFDEEEQQGKGHNYYNPGSFVTTNTTTTVGDGFQDIYSIHPEGILTLHRCWLTQTMVKRRENGRVVEKLELNVKEGDVAEWNVARKPDWDQVRMMKKKKHNRQQHQQHQQTGWLSYAEITTYDSEFEKSLWDCRYYSHISFHTFIEQENGMLSGDNTNDTENDNNNNNNNNDDGAEKYFNLPFVPPTVQLYFTQNAPEPYASRIDRVGRTSAASRDGTLLLDDALAELEENISNAMTSSFSPSPTAGFLNTPRPNSSSLTSLFSSTTTSSNPSVIAADQVSFEDACLVTVGNEEQEKVNDHYNDTYNNDSTTNDNELKVGEQELCFPDGDNELASPHEEDNLVMLNNDK